jgi:hypothetical protein
MHIGLSTYCVGVSVIGYKPMNPHASQISQESVTVIVKDCFKGVVVRVDYQTSLAMSGSALKLFITPAVAGNGRV